MFFSFANFVHFIILAEAAEGLVKSENVKTGLYGLISSITGALIVGFFAWLKNKNRDKNDKFATFMAESEKYRKELRDELDRHSKNYNDEIIKLKVIVKDQEILIKVLEEKLSLDIKYKALIDNLPQIVWTAKPDGNVDYYNARGYQYAGKTLSFGKDYGWAMVFHPDDMQKGMEIWTKCVKSGEPYYYTYRLKRASDGMYRWHIGIAFPRINDAGEIVQWVGSCTDIHDYREQLLKDCQDTLQVNAQ